MSVPNPQRESRAPGGDSAIERAIADFGAGKPVIVVDDEDRENEGDIIFAAELATPELVAFLVRHTSGYVCVPLAAEDCDRLDLPPMYHTNQDRRQTAYAVTVDARVGGTTGISAVDRARTIRLLADPTTRSSDLNRPGHIVPLRAVAGGVLKRPGHTEAAIDLARLAGLRPAGVLAEVVSVEHPTEMARYDELVRFADEHGLTLITIADLVAYRRRVERQVRRITEARVPTRYGEFRAVGYDSQVDGVEHVALICGDLGDGEDVLVRLHSECLTGDVLGSLRCDCGEQLDQALRAVQAEGRGIVVYLRGHEGRGIGLLHKLQAYRLQDAGADTVDANLNLGLPADARDYSGGAQILLDLGVRSIRLLSNNPAKVSSLAEQGISVRRLPVPVRANAENLRYLRTKRDRMGHTIVGLPDGLPDGVAEGLPESRADVGGLAQGLASGLAPGRSDGRPNGIVEAGGRSTGR